jgi:hypothetical protein
MQLVEPNVCPDKSRIERKHRDLDAIRKKYPIRFRTAYELLYDDDVAKRGYDNNNEAESSLNR